MKTPKDHPAVTCVDRGKTPDGIRFVELPEPIYCGKCGEWIPDSKLGCEPCLAQVSVPQPPKDKYQKPHPDDGLLFKDVKGIPI